MSDMTEGEALERIREGLKKAASAAREIAASSGFDMWKDIANIVDEMRQNASKLAQQTALSRFDVLKMLDERQKKISPPSETVN